MNTLHLSGTAILVAILLASPAADAKDKKGKGSNEQYVAQTYINAPPAAQATASRLLVNPFGEVDGVLLDTGTIVTFPPHMSEALRTFAKPGDALAVKGYPERPTQIKGYVLVNVRSNQTLVVHPKPAPGAQVPKHLKGAGLKEMSAQGEIRHLRYGGRGEINGAILADGTIIRFPREVSYRFSNLLQLGQQISAAGYGTQNEYGRALEITALAAAGQPPQPVYTR
jgi:hypothetical protein